MRLAIGGKPDYVQVQGKRYKVHTFSLSYNQQRNVRGDLVEVVQISIHGSEGEDRLENLGLF